MQNNFSLEAKYKLLADTIRLYPNQIQQAWDDVKHLQIPNEYKSADNVNFCGMGGSALGARMVKSFGFNRLRVPVEIVNGYSLPNYAGPKSLVIVSSYSGSTEETIESLHHALKSKAKIFGITTGGKLFDILKKEKLPNYSFEPTYNPSGQPRMAIGYAFGATLSLFNKLGFLTVNDSEIENAISYGYKVLTQFHENTPSFNNLSYDYAKIIKGKIPVLVASEHLLGVCHTLKNQFNESAKTFSVLFDIPELNHHLMEGLSNPAKQKEMLLFILFTSNLYGEKIIKRYKVTQKVLEKNSIEYMVYNLQSDDVLSQILETLIFGSFTVYYLTKFYKIDPLEIPWVDFFKKELAK